MKQNAVSASRFVSFLKSEELREEIILVVDGPLAGKSEPFALPQHRLETCNRSSCRSEGLKAADLRHVLLHSEMVALDPLLQILGDILDRVRMQKPIIDGSLDR